MMKKNMMDEQLPHKKMSPKKFVKPGCPENDYREHDYAAFTPFFYMQSQEKCVHLSDIVRCLNCGKNPLLKHARTFNKESIPNLGNVMKFEDGFWEVRFSKDMKRAYKIAKLFNN